MDPAACLHAPLSQQLDADNTVSSSLMFDRPASQSSVPVVAIAIASTSAASVAASTSVAAVAAAAAASSTGPCSPFQSRGSRKRGADQSVGSPASSFASSQKENNGARPFQASRERWNGRGRDPHQIKNPKLSLDFHLMKAQGRTQSKSKSNFKQKFPPTPAAIVTVPQKFRVTKLSDAKLTRTNDEVHNTIDFCPVMKAIVDTPQFQRLRSIKQLGMSHHVYACANHTRFEHSLGVAHLAKQVSQRIQIRQPNLQTTDKDVLCVKLAGLLHDIGHGPFSHVYESFRHSLSEDLAIFPERRQAYQQFDRNPATVVPDGWCHEQASLMMIDAALAELGMKINYQTHMLDQPLQQIGDGVDVLSMKVFGGDDGLEDTSAHADTANILTSRDWIFIKECIIGGPISEVKDHLGITDRIGRLEPHKEWLYDIVANKHNNLDVDKLEYFARDKRRALGESGNVDIPMINDAIVAKAKCSNTTCDRCHARNTHTNDAHAHAHAHGDQPLQQQQQQQQQQQLDYHFMICYPIKHVKSALKVFRERHDLHETVYQHKTINSAAMLACDIFKLADTKYLVDGLPLSRCLKSPRAYLKLTDDIFALLRSSTDPALKPAQKLIDRLDRHNFYKRAAERVITTDDPVDEELWKKKSNEIIQDLLCITGTHNIGNPRSAEIDDGTTDHDAVIRLQYDDILIDKACMHYGNKSKNPLSLLRFVSQPCKLSRKASLDELPFAEPANEKDFQSVIPQDHMKRVLRIYCRTPEKLELLQHVCYEWQRQLEENQEEMIRASSLIVRGLQDDPTNAPNASGDDARSNRLGNEEERESHAPSITPAPDLIYGNRCAANNNQDSVDHQHNAGDGPEDGHGEDGSNVDDNPDDTEMYLPMQCTQDSVETSTGGENDNSMCRHFENGDSNLGSLKSDQELDDEFQVSTPPKSATRESVSPLDDSPIPLPNSASYFSKFHKKD